MARQVEKVSCGPFPTFAGSYALRLVLTQATRVVVGKLGLYSFPAGDYLYLGSAMGPGGLCARLDHHLRAAGKPHWHIDWLRQYASLPEIWYTTRSERLECAWTQALIKVPASFIPVPGFGASDCQQGCAAHLLSFPAGISSALIEDQLRLVGSGIEVLSWKCSK